MNENTPVINGWWVFFTCISTFLVIAGLIMIIDARVLEVFLAFYIFNIIAYILVSIFVKLYSGNINLALVLIFLGVNITYYSFSYVLYRFLFKQKMIWEDLVYSIVLFTGTFSSIYLLRVVFNDAILIRYISYTVALALINFIFAKVLISKVLL